MFARFDCAVIHGKLLRATSSVEPLYFDYVVPFQRSQVVWYGNTHVYRCLAWEGFCRVVKVSTVNNKMLTYSMAQM
jgi:hypothetical protein